MAAGGGGGNYYPGTITAVINSCVKNGNSYTINADFTFTCDYVYGAKLPYVNLQSTSGGTTDFTGNRYENDPLNKTFTITANEGDTITITSAEWADPSESGDMVYLESPVNIYTIPSSSVTNDTSISGSVAINNIPTPGNNTLRGGFGIMWGAPSFGGAIRGGKQVEIDISGQVRIEITPDTSINGQTHIKRTETTTVNGQTRIIRTDTKNILGIVRVEKTAQTTAQGIVRIGHTEHTDISGSVRVGYIIKTDISGRVRITGGSGTVLNGQVRISKYDHTDISGQTRVEFQRQIEISGQTRIARTEQTQIDGVVDIDKDVQTSVDGIVRIGRVNESDISGQTRVEITETTNIDGVVRIELTNTKDITGQTRIEHTNYTGLDGIVNVVKYNRTNIDGIVRIANTYQTEINGRVSLVIVVPEKTPQKWSNPTEKAPETWHYDDPEKQPETWETTDKTAPSDWSDSSDSTKEPQTWNDADETKEPETWHYEKFAIDHEEIDDNIIDYRQFDLEFLGRQQIIGTTKYIRIWVPTDRPIDANSQIKFIPGLVEAFDYSGMLFSLANPDNSKMKITCSVPSGINNMIRVQMVIKDPNITIHHNRLCGVSIYGVFEIN